METKPKRVRRTKAQLEAERGKQLAAQVNGLSIPQVESFVESLDPAVSIFIRELWEKISFSAAHSMMEEKP